MAKKKDNNVKVFKEVDGHIETIYEGIDDVLVSTQTEKQYENKLKQSDNLKQKNKRINEIKRLIEMLGPYFHIKYDYNDKIFKDLEDMIDISRLFVLASYVMNPKGRRKYYKKDLSEIWGTTSRNSINKTYNLLLEYGYIKLNKDGVITMNEAMMKAGAGFKTKHPTTYTRIFCDGGVDFYNSLASKQKKYYGLIVAILPYVNFKYNVLCANPTETDVDKLELLDWKDLCGIVGYDKSQSSRLSKELIKLKINDSAVFMAHTDFKGTRITINPSLYYAGDNVEDLDYLFNLFKMNPKKNK